MAPTDCCLHTPQGRPALEAVYEGDAAQVDIIAVHGLGADVDWSWTWKDSSDPKNADRHVRWLADPDMLPAIIPDSRILLYNYDSRWHADAPKTRLQLCGEDLTRNIRDFQEKTASRPIVFVGHSLGGNVIQHALLYANSDDDFKHIVTSTAGLIFLGSPLRGSRFQPLSQFLASLLQLAGSHDGVVRDLNYDDENLMDKLHQFCLLRNCLSIPTSCFFELYETDYPRRYLGVRSPIKGRVVDEASACIPGLSRIPLAANHSGMNKFSGPSDRSFRSVSAELRRLCRDAPSVVGRRKQPKSIITDRDYILREKPEAKECLRHLFLTDPYEDMQALKRKKGGRAKGTCNWILGTDEVTAWLNDSPESAFDVLWLHGNPGTGKSIMSMFLADKLSDAFSKTPDKTLAYFFCDSGFDTRKTATAIVRGLLLQLVQQHPCLIEHVLLKYEERKAKMFDSFDALWSIFLKACADTATGRKYCVIDALDECLQDEQETLLKQIKNTFAQDRIGDQLNLRILVTSRPYLEISERLQIFPNRDLASFPQSRRDVDKFVSEKVAELRDMKKWTPGLTQKVIEMIRQKAGGIFLWVGLACQELEEVPARSTITRLEKIPQGLQSIYKQLLDTAMQQEEDPDTIKMLLGFVMVARRPLSTRELASACNLYEEESEEDRIRFTADDIAACRLMIIVQDEKVLLLHQSVKDFLLGQAAATAWFVSELELHNRLAGRCVSSLIENLSGLQGSHNDLVSYSTRYWPEHAHMAKEAFKIDDGQSAFFSIYSKTRDRWLERYSERILTPRGLSIFHVAAIWGIPSLVHHALSLGHGKAEEAIPTSLLHPYIDSAHGDAVGGTPLEACVWSNQIQVFMMLLERSDQVEERVVRAVAQNEKYSARFLEVLLEKKRDKITITEDIVVASAQNSGSGAEVLKLLLDHYGDQIVITENIIEAAARNIGSGAEVLKLLLDHYGDQIVITENIIEAAAQNSGSGAEVLKLLLDHRGDYLPVAGNVVTNAVFSGNLDAIKVLLAKGADISVVNKNGKAPIQVAVDNWDLKMAQFLVQHGADITVVDSNGWTPIHWPHTRGNSK